MYSKVCGLKDEPLRTGTSNLKTVFLTFANTYFPPQVLRTLNQSSRTIQSHGWKAVGFVNCCVLEAVYHLSECNGHILCKSHERIQRLYWDTNTLESSSTPKLNIQLFPVYTCQHWLMRREKKHESCEHKIMHMHIMAQKITLRVCVVCV